MTTAHQQSRECLAALAARLAPPTVLKSPDAFYARLSANQGMDGVMVRGVVLWTEVRDTSAGPLLSIMLGDAALDGSDIGELADTLRRAHEGGTASTTGGTC